MISCAGNFDDGQAPGDDDVQLVSAVSRQAQDDFLAMTQAELAAYVPEPDDLVAFSADECRQSNCSGVVACTGWSGSIACDETFCGVARRCPGPPGDPGDATFRVRERFRLCWNLSGEQCEEWEVAGSQFDSCGCR